MVDTLHPQAPSGSQLYLAARFAQSHFVSHGPMKYFRRVKSIAGFVANRPRVRNENQDPSRQVIPGVNVEASLDGMKVDYKPDVDSIVPFRAHHNGTYEIGAQVGGTAGAGTVATNGTGAIVGTLSAFTAALVGKYISIAGEPDPLLVTVYTDATHITVSPAATTTAAGLAWQHASIPVFPWTFHPREPGEAEPDTYVDSMDFEFSDGDGYPGVDYECAQQDFEIKVVNGAITDGSENWMGCYDTYASDAEVIRAVSAYASAPFLYGHFTDANALKLPLHVKVTSAASTGINGKLTAALTRSLTGTVETDGTDMIAGTGTLFLTELTVGDSVYIPGEDLPLIVESITNDLEFVATVAATSTDTGLTATAATFAGAETAFLFDIPTEVRVNGARVGNSPFDNVWLTFPSGHGTVSIGDEWTITEPRVLPEGNYSSRDVLHGAGLQVTIDGVPYGGVPGFAGFHDATIKLTIPRKANKTTGSKYAQGIQSNGKTMATVSFNRDRTDREFLKKLIASSYVTMTLNMYGNPYGDTGFDELHQIVIAKGEVASVQRDVSTENTLPEKIDINAVRSPDGTPIWEETIYTTLAHL